MTFVRYEFSGSNAITHSGILKHFKTVEPSQALAELIWNGYDAGATDVEVKIDTNDIHGTEYVYILDNGSGIDFKTTENNFRRFNDSLKKDSYDTHGYHGRGRLAFHKICREATWLTKFENENASISIASSNLSDIEGYTISPEEQHHALKELTSGTCVRLSNFKVNLPRTEELLEEFRKIFGAHLAMMPQKRLWLNGILVTPQDHELHQTQLEYKDTNFDITLIHWMDKPGTEKSFIHLISQSNKILYKYFSSLNRKRGYYSSIYVKSEIFDRYSADDVDMSEPLDAFLASNAFRELTAHVAKFAKSIYADFLIKQADLHVSTFESQGDFPDYSNLDNRESTWRLANVKNIVKSVLIREPSLLVGSNKKQRRLIIRLLDRLSISNENSGIYEILESILQLDNAAMNKLATQLKKTKLENIINTIEILQNRELAVAQLKEIMDNHYANVLETPDLQQVIESNTWLFGGKYEILGAEEDSFTTTTKNLRETIKGIENIELDDIAEGVKIEGAQKQVDLFLARKCPQYDAHGRKYYRCVIVEIKRPGISLNDKHLSQIDSYASILSKYPAFNSDLTKFEIILIGRCISSEAFGIHSRIETSTALGEPGLITSTPKVKTYIKTWPRIFDEFELTNEYLLERLKTQREALSDIPKEELLRSLQTASEINEPASAT